MIPTTLIIAILVTATFAATPQSQPEQVVLPFDLMWESSISDIERTMLEQPGISLDEHVYADSSDELRFNHGLFFGFPVRSWVFRFHLGSLVLVDIIYDIKDATPLLDAYTDVSKRLRYTYSRPVKEISPELGDGIRQNFGDEYVLRACIEGQLWLFHVWQFGPTTARQYISAAIDESGRLKVRFGHLTKAKMPDPY